MSRLPLKVDLEQLGSSTNNVPENPQPQPKGKLINPQIKGFKPPVLAHGFNLDNAVDIAYKRAGSYLNKVLGYKDMYVELKYDESKKIIGEVKDKSDNKSISKYDGMQVLKLYAQNMKERGIIVDGNV